MVDLDLGLDFERNYMSAKRSTGQSRDARPPGSPITLFTVYPLYLAIDMGGAFSISKRCNCPYMLLPTNLWPVLTEPLWPDLSI